nr:hypothetical protein TetV2_00188 [Oceanusvirus sp.]
MPRPRVHYRCESCGFSTNRRPDFKRHVHRKNNCANERAATLSHSENIFRVAEGAPAVAESAPWVAEGAGSVAEGAGSVAEGAGSVTEGAGSVAEGVGAMFQCSVCQKTFTRQRNLRSHKCKGYPSNHCPTCGVTFSSKYTKYRHVKSGCTSSTRSQDEEPVNGVNINVVDNSVTTHNNVTNINVDKSVTDNSVTNVYVSFGSEELSHLESFRFKEFLLYRFDGWKERVIPTAKAVYFNPKCPENYGSLKPKSSKQKTLSARRQNGTFYSSSAHVLLQQFVERTLHLLGMNEDEKRRVMSKLATDPQIKFVLGKELMALVEQNPRIPRERTTRQYHNDEYNPPPPDASVSPFVWPSVLVDQYVRGQRPGYGYFTDKQITDNEIWRAHDILFPLCFLENNESVYEEHALVLILKKLWKLNPPFSVSITWLDNDLDDRWSVVRVWDGKRWVAPQNPHVSDPNSEIDAFFASIVIDLCDSLNKVSRYDDDFAASSFDELKRIKNRVIAGHDRVNFRIEMYRLWHSVWNPPETEPVSDSE